ncbi:MAG: PEGA domain-containing protein [Labilithrix sp.]|nr:PEGA domain-containing protein [Labilithrix sp.]MCW5816462.1 PEGA domain-containing protein [Labilithrix sp.]
MRSLRRALVVLVTAVALFALARPAVAAPSKEGCISANEDADVLRRRGALRAARVSLLACSAPECPQIVRDDCVAHLEEVDAAMPTVLFTALENGVAVTDVEIGVDHKPFAGHLYAEPLPIDPGEHTLTFEKKGYPIQTRRIAIKEGEKGRRETIVFGSATVSAPEGRLVVTAEAGARITIDDLSPVSDRFDGTVATGKHEVRVRKTGKRPYSKSVDVKAAETQTLHVVLEDEARSLTPWLIGGAIVVAVAAIVVGGVLIAGSSSGNDATARPGSTSTGLSLASF